MRWCFFLRGVSYLSFILFKNNNTNPHDYSYDTFLSSHNIDYSRYYTSKMHLEGVGNLLVDLIVIYYLLLFYSLFMIHYLLFIIYYIILYLSL